MQNQKKVLAMCMMLLLICNIHLIAQNGPKCLALITDFSGNVTVKKAKRTVLFFEFRLDHVLRDIRDLEVLHCLDDLFRQQTGCGKQHNSQREGRDKNR